MRTADYDVKWFDRLKFAFKAFYHVVAQKPIIFVFFEPGCVYARSSPHGMAAAAQTIAETAEESMAEMLLEDYKQLIDIPKHREN
jgi:hypothetical protein